MPIPSLRPARLACAADAAPVSEAFADSGPDQAQHVFLHGNGVPERWRNQRNFTLLENGFGAGLNFLATWAAWREDPQRPQKLHYLATELHPFRVEDLARLHGKWPELEFLAEALRNSWPLSMPGFHRLEFAAGRVVLTLLLGDAEASLRKLRASIDAFYLDGFEADKNPEMWSPALLRRCAQLAAPNATFATRCVASQVKQTLHEVGFVFEQRPGFGENSEMLAGKIADRPKLAKNPPQIGQRQAVVIGAGLAGCAIAERLAVRGWRVVVLDRHPEPAGEASGNLAGILRPMLSRDDNLASRLNRACFLYLNQPWRRLDHRGHPPRRNLGGILQIARDEEHEALQRDWLAANEYPEAFVQFLDQADASRRLGAEAARGGWWFPHGGWASPPSLCRAWLSSGCGNIHFQGGVEIADLERVADAWRLLDAAGETVAQAPVVIFATGATQLPHTAGLPITPVRGQVSHLDAGMLPKLAHAACSEGYLTPALNGVHCLGASYLKDGLDTELRAGEHAENLLRLARMLPSAAHAFDPGELTGRVGFRATTPDHLPLAGALPDLSAQLKVGVRFNTFPRHAGLFGLLGLGSRGLVWSSLLAEHLACVIDAEPSPLAGDQADAIDPARFALRAQRHR
ncbi:MAG: bifunctional tRNA (5-methylaminomethyl-2-thiouridine)(34)-methyltransferase MnmD/FAD-dependent 5-carboxymethylaminomethyl-2-thiouridine(34) oxidoreductase MnmC [Pseudomonadota bacterium]|nr:bifunctional tRNA (5-methylaminomethyl-2-thiouridine)(34)-methyltransferase MnmD/FAD-dependent 5-carboxymethylaminomethyl-2-thiouridine(34) oxidoreductase MnmC [Pseudomonadota bacterium]